MKETSLLHPSGDAKQQIQTIAGESISQHLLFSTKKVVVKNFPFYYGYIDNFLPQDLFEDLQSTFPEEPLTINYNSETVLSAENPRFKEFFSKNPKLKNLLFAFTSEPFLRDLQNFTMTAVIRDRGSEGRKDWFYVTDWSVVPNSKDVTPIKVAFTGRSDKSFPFQKKSKLRWLPPHTDMPSKILTMILYLPRTSWNQEYGGGLDIYVPKFSFLNNNWPNIVVPFELMTRWDTIKCVPNRLVFFVKSKNSWHGVSPFYPRGGPRRSLVIAIHNKPEKQGPFQRRLYGLLKSISVRLIGFLVNRKMRMQNR